MQGKRVSKTLGWRAERSTERERSLESDPKRIFAARNRADSLNGSTRASRKKLSCEKPRVRELSSYKSCQPFKKDYIILLTRQKMATAQSMRNRCEITLYYERKEFYIKNFLSPNFFMHFSRVAKIFYHYVVRVDLLTTHMPKYSK